MAAYDSSKDKSLYEGNEATIGKQKYRLSVYQYEKGQPKLAIEHHSFRPDGSSSWRLISGRIPSEVVALLINELPKVLPHLGLLSAPTETEEEEVTSTHESEKQVVAASVLQQETTNTKKRMSIKGVTHK